MKEETKVIVGVKGFDLNLKCRDYQFEVGKTHKEKSAKCCKSGFHFCENPLDVFGYYPPGESRFCIVEGSGDIDREGDDSKVSCTELKVVREIQPFEFADLAKEYILKNVTDEKSNTGDQSSSSNTGDQSSSSNTGDQSSSSNTGYKSSSSNTGYKSSSSNTGNYSSSSNTGYKSSSSNTGDQSSSSNTGDQSSSSNTGNYSSSSNTGDQSSSSNTGNYSSSSVSGSESVAIVTGYQGKAKGALGCWIVLTERNSEMEILDIRAVKVDGDSIKADTYYQLLCGVVSEAGDQK